MKPALRRGWRDLKTVQFGVAPAHAVVFGPLDTATASLLSLLDGTRGLPLLREEGRRIGLPDGHVDQLLSRLSAAGLLDDSTGGGTAADALRQRPQALERLRPDHASLSVIDPEPGGGIRRLAARRASRVQVRGAGRVGATVASVLAGAGVGHVDVLDGGCVEPGDVAPGGLPAESIGERRDKAALRQVRRCAPDRPPRRTRSERSAGDGTRAIRVAGAGAAPSTGTGSAPSIQEVAAIREIAAEPGFSLVVLAPRDGLATYAPDPVSAEPFMSSGTPHLYTGVIEGTGVVGPLVLPGATACAGCLDLGRRERDGAWPRLLAQWRSGRPRTAPACDLALATAVAGLAAAHALAFLDGEFPAAIGTRWEAALPGLDWRSARWDPHPECPCGAYRPGEREDTSKDFDAHDTMAG